MDGQMNSGQIKRDVDKVHGKRYDEEGLELSERGWL